MSPHTLAGKPSVLAAAVCGIALRSVRGVAGEGGAESGAAVQLPPIGSTAALSALVGARVEEVSAIEEALQALMRAGTVKLPMGPPPQDRGEAPVFALSAVADKWAGRGHTVDAAYVCERRHERVIRGGTAERGSVT